ncbi:MAG: zinc ribbon domain-containing protein [Coriobacteriia bacterium]|nr:zinc ribbon domain-containing protein [Coriobacteriia bacterium]
MTGRRNSRQFVLAILGGGAGLAALVGVVVLINGADGASGAVAASPVGWTIPLASLFIIVGVTWLLLSQTPKDAHRDSTDYAPCDSCGRSVLRDWRLCPYCGNLLEVPESDEVLRGA